MVHGGPEVRRALPLAALLVALAACSAPELQTTGVDVDRAFRAAQDPWAAPQSVDFPTQMYGSADPLRDAGSRSVTYSGVGAPEIARIEITAAQESGWTLASVECAEEPRFTIALTRGDADLDQAALALLSVDKHAADVRLLVPHHGDGSWPQTSAVELAETCIEGGPLNEAPASLPFGLLPGDGASPPLEDFEPWQRDTVSDDERAVVDEVLADPLLAGIDLDDPVEVAEMSLDTGDNWRQGLSTGTTIRSEARTTREAVAEVVNESDWILTWARCDEWSGTQATARIPVARGTVTAFLSSTNPGMVSVSVTLPVPEAPLTYPQVEEVPALRSSRCLGTGDLGPGVTLEGIPVALPRRLHPYLDD